jgi:hypothetical protein
MHALMGLSTVSVARLSATFFVATAVPMGVFAGLFTWGLRGSPSRGAILGVEAGTSFGALMTAVLVGLHVLGARRCGARVADVHQADAFVVPGDIERVQAAAEGALREVGVASVRTTRSDTVLLEGRTPWSLQSSGEIVRIEIGPPTGECVPVHVASRPAWRTTLVDYGKNLTNVEVLRAAMTS